MTHKTVNDKLEANNNATQKLPNDNHILTKLLTKFGIEFDEPIEWYMVFYFSFFHIVALYGLFFGLDSPTAHLRTILWGVFSAVLCGIGITAGAHRHWTHKSYKAKFPLQLILFVLFSASGLNSLYEWMRDHKLHHRYTETNADPHNSKRGFFFAHIGWLMLAKHPEFLEKENEHKLIEIMNDPFVRFNEKYYVPMKFLLCFFLPTIVPVYGWNESWWWSILAIAFVRYIGILNITWAVNSVAHFWGNKPYNQKVSSVESQYVSLLSLGEGWHNYHHVFPWDYRAAELGNYRLNLTTLIIETFAKIGWAYDLKTPSKEVIRNTILKHGDGTHFSVQ